MSDHPDLVRLHARERSPLADGVGLVLDPLILVATTLICVSVATVGSVVAGLGWAALTLVFCAVIPEIALRVVMHRRGITDRQLVVREHRHLPVAIAVVSVLLGVVVLRLAGAPAAVSGVVLTILVGAAAMALITRWWKASFHAAVAASMTVVLGAVFGPTAVVLGTASTLLIGWARVRAGRHSLAQTVAGVLIGALASLVTFPADALDRSGTHSQSVGPVSSLDQSGSRVPSADTTVDGPGTRLVEHHARPAVSGSGRAAHSTGAVVAGLSLPGSLRSAGPAAVSSASAPPSVSGDMLRSAVSPASASVGKFDSSVMVSSS